MKKFFILMILLFFVFFCNLTSCKFGTEYKDQEALEKALGGKDQKYFSANDPGKWDDQTKDHVPQYKLSISKDKKYRLIDVTIPFRGSIESSHYIEAILLLDHNNNELDKTIFTRGETQFYTQFKLPITYKSYIYIVAKCSQHDMWRVKIFPTNR